MPRLWWALTQDELPRPRWRALQKYKILYTLFGVCPVWWGRSKLHQMLLIVRKFYHRHSFQLQEFMETSNLLA
jgi:hypothetical protein